MTQSLRTSINAFCKGCIYDPYQTGLWREQVEACTSRKCPLYAVRPLAKRRSAARKAKDAARRAVPALPEAL